MSFFFRQKPETTFEKADKWTSKKRQAAATAGKARPDGSWPIADAEDVANAVADWGRAGASSEIKAWIIQRAHAVPGGTAELPADWEGSTKEPDKKKD